MSESNCSKSNHLNPAFSTDDPSPSKDADKNDFRVNIDEKIGNTDTKIEPQFYNIYNIYNKVPQAKTVIKYFKEKNGKGYLRKFIICTCLFLYLIYFVTALLTPSVYDISDYWCDGDGILIINTIFFGTLLLYFQVVKPHLKYLEKRYVGTFISKAKEIKSKRSVNVAIYIVLTISFLAFLLIDASADYTRLISAFGALVVIGVGVLFSEYPTKIKFDQVFWGIGLQLIFALMILRWPFGKQLFQCLGAKVSRFLSFTDAGTLFAIGDFLKDINSYAFKILPVVLYFGMFISILYHYGIVQWVIIKLGWVLEVILKTTPCESMATVANIFLGMSEAPLVIKPYISLLTKSELHTIMTGGFATVAGGVLAAYISFGVEPAHLLSASIMSAPAALVMSKVFYPEVEVSQTKHENIKIIRERGRNVLHAIMIDLKDNIVLIAIIVASIIVCMGAAAFINAFADWSCQVVGYDEGVCQVQKILGYLLAPVAWLMGVPREDCYFVGYLLGMKIFVTEFLAYMELMERFKQGLLSARSVVIATYALCGFSNIAGMGSTIGSLSCLAPSRARDVSFLVFRAFVAGNFACILTACVAGTLIDDPSSRLTAFNINSTIPQY